MVSGLHFQEGPSVQQISICVFGNGDNSIGFGQVFDYQVLGPSGPGSLDS